MTKEKEVRMIWEALTLENKKALLTYLYKEEIISEEVMDPDTGGPFYIGKEGGNFREDLVED